MDPTVALPLHFTIETAVLTAGALVVAWAALRRRWPAAASALALTVAQALHAGQFVAGEDEPIIIALRSVGILGLAAAVLPFEGQRQLFAGGLGALAVGTVWGTIDGGTADDFSVIAHVLLFAGAVALLIWVWYATRPSVRLRVVAAFVSILAVAVVVAGGAIARVAALDSRTDQHTHLGDQALAAREDVGRTGDELSRQAAAISPALAIDIQRGDETLDDVQLRSLEWAVLVRADGTGLAKKSGTNVAVPYALDRVVSLGVFEQARQGDVSFATTVERQGLIVVAAAPVYRPTIATGPSDVVAIIVLGRTLAPADLGAILSDRTIEVAVVGERHSVSSNSQLPVERLASGSESGPFQTVDTPEATWFATLVRLPGGNVQAIVATADDVVVEATTELVRAFLVAILGAALLAVIGALWLSARITRPLLELADDAERVKADFLSSVSHELRTPLTPIRGYTELLRRGVPARSRPGYLDEIGNATQRLERIVSLLVDVAAMGAGRYRIAEEDISVRQLFDDAIQRWRERKAPSRIEVRLPKGALNVTADAAAIGRVLDELIDNALKFATDSVVELRGRRVGGRVELSVRDEGPGIDPERMAALKTAFSTGERGGDTKRYGGLGLGLSFVEGVLEAHGGRLEIDSRPGDGTTCTFTLRAAGSVTAMPAKEA